MSAASHPNLGMTTLFLRNINKEVVLVKFYF